MQPGRKAFFFSTSATNSCSSSSYSCLSFYYFHCDSFCVTFQAAVEVPEVSHQFPPNHFEATAPTSVRKFVYWLYDNSPFGMLEPPSLLRKHMRFGSLHAPSVANLSSIGHVESALYFKASKVALHTAQAPRTVALHFW